MIDCRAARQEAKDSISVLLVGCGRMGSALLQGWIKQPGFQFSVVEQNAISAVPSEGVSLQVYADPKEIPEDVRPDVVVFAVKPEVLLTTLAKYARFAEAGSLCLSIAAGVGLSRLEHVLPAKATVVRAMPNTPAAIGRGATVAVPNRYVTASHRRHCECLMGAVGDFVWVEDETLLNLVTAVSGSGPAYLFLLMESLANAGLQAGLPEELATRLAEKTICGAARLVEETGYSPSNLRKAVTSPGGATAAALSILMTESGLPDLMMRTVARAAERARELESRGNTD
jgi:pyrroline-5-carboxylate reductase